MYASAPNIAIPVRRPAAVTRLKFLLRNIARGITGSSALRSTQTKAMAVRTVSRISEMMTGEPHA